MKYLEPIERFILPDEKISLKLVFDNFRNYILCGAIGTIVILLEQRDVTEFPIKLGPSPDWDALIVWGKTIFFAFVVLNMLQGILIFLKFTRLIIDFYKKYVENFLKHYEKGIAWPERVIFYGGNSLYVLMAILFVIQMSTLFFMMILIALSVMNFSVLKSFAL